MIENLPLLQRRILAVLLLLVAIAAIVRIVAVPIWRTYVGNRDDIVQMEDTIERYTRVSSQAESLSRTVEKLERADELDSYVLPQNSEPLAAAALQERIKSVVATSGGTLTSTQVLPTKAEQGFTQVVISVRMAVSTDALQGVLYELEGNLPYLVIDELLVLSRQGNRRRQTVQPGDMLDVRFTLRGFMPERAKPA